ncbi:MAG: helix-turn-helix domain-containing protein [Flavobacteriales bacterium]
MALNYKKTALSIFVVGTLLTTIAFFFREQKLNLFPNNSYFKVASYTDSSEGGNSILELKVDPGKFASMNYTLGNKLEYPFLGMYFQNKVDSNYLDISAYESMVINIKADKASMIPIDISVFCDGISQYGKPNSYVSHIYDLKDEKINGEYRISLDKFTVPEWWYTENAIENSGKLKCNFEKMQSINIEQGVNAKAGVSDNIAVYDLYLKKENIYYLYIFLLSMILGVTALVIDYVKRKKTVFVPYQTTPEIHNGNDALENKVFDYIANNYSNPDLSLSSINADTGIAENKISSIIKTKCNQSFKQYINNIRMTEAKRLLKESDATISEIAYSVGYNNVTHFNRVFKTETGIAPGDFRKNAQSAETA